MTGVAKKTVSRLLVEIGKACSDYQDEAFVNLKCKRVQCDEIWSFVGAKEKNCTAEMKAKGNGDVWTWTAIDADTKLIPCWFVGGRDASCVYHFIHDLAARLANRVQLTTDGHKTYLSVVEDAFGCDIDYGMLVKVYGRKCAIRPLSAWERARRLSVERPTSNTFPRAILSART
jgi:IS1 family transposase